MILFHTREPLAMTNLFETHSDLGNFLYRVTDNGGSTIDRYTVAFADGSFLAISCEPSLQNGDAEWFYDLDPEAMSEAVSNGIEIDIAFCDLPQSIQDDVIRHLNAVFFDQLAEIVNRDETAVAPDRASAISNTPLECRAGAGIYFTNDAFFVKIDSAIGNDLGPFASAREVLLASLPDRRLFRSPELQSTVEINRTTPDADVAKAVATLECRVASSVTRAP
jgi:hypothetical protein